MDKISTVHTANLDYLDYDNLKQINWRFLNYAKNNFANNNVGSITNLSDTKQYGVLQLINAYRFSGHLFAKLDPLNRANINEQNFDLDFKNFNLNQQDLLAEFDTGSFFGASKTTLNNIINKLTKIYCSTIGFDYMHIVNIKEKRFLQEKIEAHYLDFELPTNKKKWVFQQLTAAETLESFLHNKYVGQKRFSLEGGEALIPALNHLIEYSKINYNTQRISLGMAHRGRLNVLVNVFGKQLDTLFKEFSGDFKLTKNQTGDVKYHLGFSSSIKINGGFVHVTLAFNPSHLEIVNPVIEGYTRYYQEKLNDTDGSKVIPLVLHGDAAFIGQGVVMETFNMSQSKGFRTRGTIHVVVNNQIGFTTSNQNDARSTHHCTDVAKMLNIPIIHVNAEDLKSVIFAVELATDYRMKFNKDVVIDLVCYRRHGHNEADEPAVTQPNMYKKIRSLKTTRENYVNKLISENIITSDEATQAIKDYRNKLKSGQQVVDVKPVFNSISWDKYKDSSWQENYNSKISKQKILTLNNRLQKMPAKFKLHPIVKKTFNDREQMAQGNIAMDWGCAEILAYASIADIGVNIRLSGQDSGRGTFFHRHAIVHNQDAMQQYIPLQNIHDKQGSVNIIDSVLSEAAVLGFEYGYSSVDPNSLVIWEAQFGDFANGAQVVIDQFIASAEVKWGRLSGLVLMLPHGLEGAGPEHSSGRIERFLQLCAKYNIQICVPTTASQIFHLIRRQILRPYRKPLIIFTPKSLLRHPLAASSLDKITNGTFNVIIGENYDYIKAEKVKRIVVCSGKIFYELLTRRKDEKINNIAIIRVEQLYPFDRDGLIKEIKKFANAKELVWCQEEPINQGAWYTSRHQFSKCAKENNLKLLVVARDLLAASAEGSIKLHNYNQNIIIEQALDLRTINEE